MSRSIEYPPIGSLKFAPQGNSLWNNNHTTFHTSFNKNEDYTKLCEENQLLKARLNIVEKDIEELKKNLQKIVRYITPPNYQKLIRSQPCKKSTESINTSKEQMKKSQDYKESENLPT